MTVKLSFMQCILSSGNKFSTMKFGDTYYLSQMQGDIFLVIRIQRAWLRHGKAYREKYLVSIVKQSVGNGMMLGFISTNGNSEMHFVRLNVKGE